MNDSHFAMSIYEEAGDVYFKGHRNQMASLPFYRVMQLSFIVTDCKFDVHTTNLAIPLLNTFHKPASRVSPMIKVYWHIQECINALYLNGVKIQACFTYCT